MILAGDIGGTNARLAFFTVEHGRLRSLAEHVYPTREHRDLESVVGEFVRDHALRPEHACFGIAAPVTRGRAAMPNLGWVVESASLAKLLGIARVTLINDLEANAYGIGALEPADFETMNAGAPDAIGNAAVIAAGTGLGEAGHAGFAPNDDLQCELLHQMRREFGHVSRERVLSGPGLFNIYRFLRDSGRGDEPPWLAKELSQRDPAARVSIAAIEGRSALCAQALELFVSIYGSEAGNLALEMMATAGAYLGGGIAPK